jgi:hypothetical protein
MGKRGFRRRSEGGECVSLVNLDDERVRQAHLLSSRHGSCAGELADFFGVCKATVQGWWQKGREALVRGEAEDVYARFLLACKSGVDAYNTEKLEKSLVKKAEGYTVKLEKVEDMTITARQLQAYGIEVPDELVRGGRVLLASKKTVSETERPPDTGALKFYLSNIARHRWRVGGDDDKPKDHRHLHAFVGGVKGGDRKLRKINLAELDDAQLELLEQTVCDSSEVVDE